MNTLTEARGERENDDLWAIQVFYILWISYG